MIARWSRILNDPDGDLVCWIPRGNVSPAFVG